MATKSETICEREFIIGATTETEYAYKTPFIRVYIYYSDRTYSLNVAHGTHEKSKSGGYDGTSYELGGGSVVVMQISDYRMFSVNPIKLHRPLRSGSRRMLKAS